MDGVKLADRIAYGAGQAARKAGVICDAYRPRDAACPVKDPNRIIRMPVVFMPVSGASCLIPDFNGAIFSSDWKEALWSRFYTAAPQRQRRSVERYNIVKRA